MKTNFLPQLQMDFSGGLGEDVSSSPMKPKTFEELFAGTGIEPTKDENGGVHYNFNATLKNEPMKLYTENQLQEAYNRGLMDGRLNNVDYSIPDGFTPIELPSDDWIMQYSDRVFEQDDNVGKLIWSEGAKFMIREISNRIINQNK